MFHQTLEELLADLHRSLREQYRANEMVYPPGTTVRVRGNIVAHSSPQAAETAKRVVPPGVNFTPGRRVSGVLRYRYLEHLREACALEYIDVTELEARISAMMLANTEDEFKFLIHDLPPLESAVKEGGKKTLKEQRSHAVEFTGYSLLATVMYAGSVPAHSVTGQIISMILWGIASVLWITTVFKWKTYNTTKEKDTKKE